MSRNDRFCYGYNVGEIISDRPYEIDTKCDLGTIYILSTGDELIFFNKINNIKNFHNEKDRYIVTNKTERNFYIYVWEKVFGLEYGKPNDKWVEIVRFILNAGSEEYESAMLMYRLENGKKC